MTGAIRLFEAGQMTRIVVLGMGRQLLTVAQFCQTNDIAMEVFTGPRHKTLTLANGAVIVDELKGRGVATTFCSSLRDCKEGPYYTSNQETLVLSFGAPFIIKQDLIDLYDGRVVNSHGAPLPSFRGGGGLSWRMLAGETRGVALYHLVTPGIDDGGIIYKREYSFPAQAGEMADWLAVLEAEEDAALMDFLNCIKEGKSLSVIDQDESRSSYFPRLNTQIHGYIDFDWPGDSIERFVKAFSSPYDGAMSYVNGHLVRIHNATYLCEEKYDHPFFNGLVIRIYDENYYVCVAGGVLKIPFASLSSSCQIALGDRFFTPRERIEAALSQRVIYTPDGMNQK